MSIYKYKNWDTGRFMAPWPAGGGYFGMFVPYMPNKLDVSATCGFSISSNVCLFMTGMMTFGFVLPHTVLSVRLVKALFRCKARVEIFSLSFRHINLCTHA
jgi:hypothetical protein